jgi:hypothetical protein
MKGEYDLTFSHNDKLEPVMVGLANTQVSICTGECKDKSKMVYNQTRSLSQRETRPKLGSFNLNPCVVRIGINNVSAQNLTFSIE